MDGRRARRRRHGVAPDAHVARARRRRSEPRRHARRSAARGVLLLGTRGGARRHDRDRRHRQQPGREVHPAGTQIWRVGTPGPGVERVPPSARRLRRRRTARSSSSTPRTSASSAWAPTAAGSASLNTPARFFLGGTFKDDLFYLADIQRKVRVFDVAGNEVQVIDENGVVQRPLRHPRRHGRQRRQRLRRQLPTRTRSTCSRPTGRASSSSARPAPATASSARRTASRRRRPGPRRGAPLRRRRPEQPGAGLRARRHVRRQVRDRRAAPTSPAPSTRSGASPPPSTARATCGSPTCGAGGSSAGHRTATGWTYAQTIGSRHAADHRHRGLPRAARPRRRRAGRRHT